MHWQELGVAVSLYNGKDGDYPIKPLESYERCYSETISDPNPTQIVKFLNSWGKMRMPFDVEMISNSIEKSKSILDTLVFHNIATVDLSQLRKDIRNIFQQFLESAKSPVATSKILHVLAPKLCVMWDTTIRASYGCGANEPVATTWNETYFIFLERVQKKLKKALLLYTNHRSLQNLEQASNNLEMELYIDGRKSLAKIVDEYNFMKYTKGSEELWTDCG